MYYAPLEDTAGDLWLVTETEDLLYESAFYGQYAPCPGSECNKIPFPEDAEPTGMIRLAATKAPQKSRIPAGIAWAFIGLVLVGAGLTTRRWYPEKFL